MTSICIQTQSQNSEYRNFFSEPITFPKHAMVAMPKANLQIPIYVSPVVNNVTITPAQYDITAIRVEIDGIHVDITWRDIYTAHTVTQGMEIITDIDAYYGGEYKYLPNNLSGWYEVGGNFNVKTGFNTILADAINTKFDFYRITPAPRYVTGFDTKVDRDLVDVLNRVDGAQFVPMVDTQNHMTDLGFNIEYAPLGIFNRNPTDLNINNEIPINWIQGVGTEDIVASTGICSMFGNSMDFDYNGGYIRTRPTCPANTGAGNMSWGIQLLGRGNQVGQEKKAIGAYDLTQIDIGIEFSVDATGQGLYKIIDGVNQFDNAGLPVYHTYTKPENAVNKFDVGLNDYFFIQIQRGNIYTDTTNYIVNILMGDNTTPHTDPNAVVIYSKNIPLNNPQIQIVPVFLANADAATDAWALHDNAFISKTAQTREQGDLNEPGNINAVGSFSLTPKVIHDGFWDGNTFNFWECWGLTTLNIYNPLLNNRNNTFTEYEGTSLSRSYFNKTNLGAADIDYTLGRQLMTDLYEYLIPIGAPGDAYVQLQDSYWTKNLPQLLYVNINNLDIKNFPGILPNNDIKGGDTRLVGTIPVPISDINLLSKVIDITYEPFNLIYRPMNNPNAFTINQLSIEFYYKDFTDNTKEKLDNINGWANIEFHIKNGAPPPKINNELRPY